LLNIQHSNVLIYFNILLLQNILREIFHEEVTLKYTFTSTL